MLAGACLPDLQASPAQEKAVSKSPGFILILMDDQGWTSMSAPMDPDLPGGGSDFHRTPNMDRLAARGMRFTSGYAPAPVCSPTRYSILYGKTPARLGKTMVRGPNPVDHSQRSLPELLKRVESGYRCAHFGKWHLDVDPEEVGYDLSDGRTTNHEGGFKRGGAEWVGYSADDPKSIDHVTRRGIEFLREQARQDTPFYLQLSHYAVHSDIVYRDSTLRETRSWTPGGVHRNAPYAAMLSDLDSGIGELMRVYDELGLAESTYVFFTSDNGGVPVIPPRRMCGKPYTTGGLNAPLRRGKWDLTEGGVRVPFVVVGPGIEAASQCDTPVVAYDLLPTLLDLAGSNEPLSPDFDGASLRTLLTDPDQKMVDRPLGNAIVFHMPHYNLLGLGEPHSALREGDYKLLHFHESERSLLFNLALDPGEKTDLAGSMPQIARRMHRTLTDYLQSVDAELPEESITWARGREGAMKTRFLEAFE